MWEGSGAAENTIWHHALQYNRSQKERRKLNEACFCHKHDIVPVFMCLQYVPERISVYFLVPLLFASTKLASSSICKDDLHRGFHPVYFFSSLMWMSRTFRELKTINISVKLAYSNVRNNKPPTFVFNLNIIVASVLGFVREKQVAYPKVLSNITDKFKLLHLPYLCWDQRYCFSCCNF